MRTKLMYPEQCLSKPFRNHKLRTALPRMIMRALFFWSTVTTFNFWLIRQPEHAVLMNDVAMVVWSTYVSLEAYSSQGRQ